MTRDDLFALYSNNNVAAFLRLIRQGESNQTPDAYTVLNGNVDHFHPPPWEHPERVGTNGTSTAAGAYQIIKKTWRSLVKQYGFEDFSPTNQDLAAIALIVGRRAIDDVVAGRVADAISRLRDEWECFQNNKRLIAEAEAIFTQWGGSLAREERDPPVELLSGATSASTRETGVTMAPIVLPILSALSSIIPQLGSLFATSEVAQRNVAAGKVVAEKLVEVTQAVNLQEAAEKIQRDPQALQAARQAIAEIWPSITEVGGGIVDARKAAMSVEQLPFYKQGVFWVTFFFVPLVYVIVLASIGRADFIGDITSETRAQVIGTVLGILLGGIVGYFYGTSAGSQRKTDVLAQR